MAEIGNRVSTNIMGETYCGILTEDTPYWVDITHRVNGNNECTALEYPFSQKVDAVAPCPCSD